MLSPSNRRIGSALELSLPLLLAPRVDVVCSSELADSYAAMASEHCRLLCDQNRGRHQADSEFLRFVQPLTLHSSAHLCKMAYEHDSNERLAGARFQEHDDLHTHGLLGERLVLGRRDG